MLLNLLKKKKLIMVFSVFIIASFMLFPACTGDGTKTDTSTVPQGIAIKLNGEDSATKTVTSAAPPAATVKAKEEGWHLVETKYFVPDSDVDVNGGPVKSKMSGTGALLLDYYQDSGNIDTGEIILTHYRTGEDGKVLASYKWKVLWNTPPSFLPAGQPASIDVEHKVLETNVWNPPVLSASFDMPDMKIGFNSSSPNTFHQPNGSKGQYRDTREEVYNMKATMTTVSPIAKGKTGDRRAIYIKFGDGYGMRYTYEWK